MPSYLRDAVLKAPSDCRRGLAKIECFRHAIPPTACSLQSTAGFSGDGVEVHGGAGGDGGGAGEVGDRHTASDGWLNSNALFVPNRMKVINECRGRYFFDPVKTVTNPLTHVPEADAAGIRAVRIVDEEQSEWKSVRGSHGTYHYHPAGSEIVISLANAVKGHRLGAALFRSFRDYLVAEVPFHDVAHRVQRITHGVKKQVWEKHANSYMEKLRERLIARYLPLARACQPFPGARFAVRTRGKTLVR